MNFWLIFVVLTFRSSVAVKLARTVVIVHPANDEERFQRSIFHALMEHGGQFSSRMQIYLYDVYYENQKTTMVMGQSERYSFKSKHGAYQMDLYRNPSTHLYTSGKEVHNFWGNSSDCLRGLVDEHKFCDSRLFKSDFQHHLARWLPMAIFDPNPDYDLLGLNVLLELFYRTFRRDKTLVKCESANLEDTELYDWPIKMFPRKCSISFGETVRLKYGFVSNENHTDYPTKIELHERTATAGEWKMTKQFKYLAFSPTFDERPIVNSNLPIGHGCRRLAAENNPRIETDYGSRFELELEVLFDYNQAARAADDHDDGSSGSANRTARTYGVRLLVDESNSINMAETIDETTNAPIRTYYEQKTHLLYSLAGADGGGQCSVYNLTSNRSLNWFYVQEMLARRPELFWATPNYSFLREFSLNGLTCLVFEETIDYRVWASEEYREWKEANSTNLTNLTNLTTRSKENLTEPPATSRARRNQVPTENNQVMATHYYPKDATYWPDNANRLAVPKRIELTIFGRFHSVAYSRMVIDIKSFKSNPKETEKYYLSRGTRCDLKDRLISTDEST